ncbi:hypothetical protein GS8_2778 [Geobacillus stearothermophilus]|uniref:Uncharacterized protein n=1 Tax=Geobacillus stearothermophilus TaxID=1422 RepID=A0ABQ7HER5_GEOSE|nr:hypothetical protein GS8_2778 [Geobacillus stearothermophilus]
MTTRLTAVRRCDASQTAKKTPPSFCEEEAFFFWPDPVVNQPFGCLAPGRGYIAPCRFSPGV